MSIPVDVAKLAEQMEAFGSTAYVLTVRDSGTPHIAHASLQLTDGALRCGASRTAAANVAARPRMSVLWPPFEPGGYSMIVDGDATVEGDELVVVPVTGVLHRPAQLATATASEPGSDGSCAADCAPIS